MVQMAQGDKVPHQPSVLFFLATPDAGNDDSVISILLNVTQIRGVCSWIVQQPISATNKQKSLYITQRI